MNTDEVREYIWQKRDASGLDLSVQGITALPPEIGQLTHLKILNLWMNQLTAMPPETGQLKNLVELELDGNPLPIPLEILAKTEEPETIISWYFKRVKSGSAG